MPRQAIKKKQENIIQSISIAKDSFLICTGARDTVFPNGDYLKYVAVDKGNFGTEIKIGDVSVTFDSALSCKIHSGMIPKVLFRSEGIWRWHKDLQATGI